MVEIGIVSVCGNTMCYLNYREAEVQVLKRKLHRTTVVSSDTVHRAPSENTSHSTHNPREILRKELHLQTSSFSWRRLRAR